MEATYPCAWAPIDDELYRNYHDEEWGVPIYDSQSLFEKLILDGFQAGLSWRTILYKREAFRKAFNNFDPEKIARYSDKKVERLLNDASIIRSKTKIAATIGNAKLWLDIMQAGETAFSDFLWEFVDGRPIINHWKNFRDAPVQSPESEAMSKALKKCGFKFCGPVIIYAFMQAVGMINDHEVDCPRHAAVQKLAR